ncbi:MAG TPA: Gfo/Idh/MocA family oxidoreductase [Bryobacteraceae bacterium]
MLVWSRRSLLAGAALLPGALQVRGNPANSALNLGIIGTGGRGQLVGGFFAADERVRVAALCDLYDDRIEQARAAIHGARTAPVYKDYRELLAAPGIDAVLIATPVFLHPEHFEAAAAAGKHVYCEKPAGADVAGVRRVERAALAARPTQHLVFGFQQRYSPEYRAAEEVIASGRLGELLFMESRWVKGGANFQNPPSPYPPEERRIRNWWANRETSGDMIVEQDCHGIDVLNWFAKATPLSAIGAGGRKKRANGDNLDHLTVTFEYPGGLRGTLIATQLTPVAHRDIRETFVGTSGLIETARNYWSWERPDQPTQRADSKREITIDSVEAFVDAVLGGRPQNLTARACTSTLTALLGRLAIDSRREVKWNEL